MKDNYKVIDTVIMPETFTLQGLDSLIKTVSSVKAVVDITDIDRDFVAITDFKAYSASDKEIPELSRNLSGEVKLVVAKEVPIVPTIKGKPAKNYIYGEKVTSPQTALITGMPEILSKINELSTEAVNIENVNTTVSILRRIRLPEGVKLFNTPTEVEVSVVIEQLSQKDIAITKDDISLQNTLIDNSLGYEMLTHNIVIEIRGNKKELEKINVASLRPSIDVGSLSGGTHSVPLKLTLPDTVKPVGDYSIDIKITGR